MANDVGIGYGSVFKIGDGASPEVFTALARVFGITPPNLTRTDVEVTDLTSASQFREYVSGMKESGEVNLNLRATYANLTILYTEFNKSVDTNYQIVSNAELDTTWNFAGRVMEVTPGELNIDGALEVSVRVKITGASTISATP